MVAVTTVMLDVKPLPCIVDAWSERPVFDAWSWCSSDVLEWRRPQDGSLPLGPPIAGENPPGMVEGSSTMSPATCM